jgi:hypothetical protein
MFASARCRRHDRLEPMPDPASLFASMLFGIIGFAAFVYGKKQVLWRPMVIGVGLMAYPYFVSQLWLLYLIGAGLCAAVYLWRE